MKTRRFLRFAILAAIATPSVALLGAMPGAAQTEAVGPGSGPSYITPFPPGDSYKLLVYGDNFADDLAANLGEVLGGGEQVDVTRKARKVLSLTRSDYGDDIRTEQQSRDVVHIGVVVVGLDDRGTLRSQSGRSIAFGSAAWKEQYGQRLDELFKALKGRKMALYVVSLPPLRRSEANAEAAVVNDVLLERSLANGLRFVDVAEGFSDESGAFTQFGLDAAGNRNKLRDADGVDFTQAGYRKLASLVATEINRDLAAARAERSVPLAGGETEQRRINPDKLSNVSALPVPKSNGARSEPRPASSGATATSSGQAAADSQGGLKAETSRIVLRFQSIAGREETAQQADLLRPAVSAAVVALLTRKETVEAVQQPYDLLMDDVGDGISVTTMISATADGTAASGRRRGPDAQAAYTAVWIKGERLETKPGRADDFSWPRRDVLAMPLPATQTSAGQPPNRKR